MTYFKFQYFAVGSADALVSLWDVNELACLRTLSRLDWPIRSVSFSYDGKLLASASEDLFIDIGHVETGKQEKCKTGQIAKILDIYNYIGHKTKVIYIDNLGEHIANVSCTSSTFTIAWHPKRYLLAYACDEKDKYDRDRSVGLLKVYGFPNEESATSRATGATGDK